MERQLRESLLLPIWKVTIGNSPLRVRKEFNMRTGLIERNWDDFDTFCVVCGIPLHVVKQEKMHKTEPTLELILLITPPGLYLS